MTAYAIANLTSVRVSLVVAALGVAATVIRRRSAPVPCPEPA